MKDSQKRPLIGLLVLLAGLFILSEFLPRNVPESGEAGVPSTTLPLATNGSSGAATDPDQLSADTPAPPPPPDAQVAQAPDTGAPRPVDSMAPPLPATAAVPRPAPQASAKPSAAPATSYQAPPTSVSSLSSYAAQDTEEKHPAPPPKAAAKPVEAKPAQPALAAAAPKEAPKPEPRPVTAPPAPALKLAQSLPPPSKTPPPPLPPVKPTPPPAPPIPKLATTVQALPPPVPAGQGRLWYVQIGSFADQGNAQTTLNLLQNIGFRGESSKASTAAGGAVYRVRLGPFPSEAVAQQALAKVSHQGYPQARVLSEASSAR